MEVGCEVDSDHQSVAVRVHKRGVGERKGTIAVEERWVEKTDWSEEAREEFRRKTKKIEIGRGQLMKRSKS